MFNYVKLQNNLSENSTYTYCSKNFTIDSEPKPYLSKLPNSRQICFYHANSDSYN